MTELVGLYTTGSDFSIASTYALPNLAALRLVNNTASSPYYLKQPSFVNVASYSAAAGAPSDGGGGTFQYISSDTTTSDNGSTVIVDASGRRWYRVWDGKHFYAAWAGMFPTILLQNEFPPPYPPSTGTHDCGPLFANLPKYCYIYFQPGTYTFYTYPTQNQFSNRFYRGDVTLWQCLGSLGSDFTISPSNAAFNWIYTPNLDVIGSGAAPYETYGGNGSTGDMTSAGVSPIEGIAILSQLDGNSGVGLVLGDLDEDYPDIPYIPENYYIRPKNFSVGGFYCNLAFLNAHDCFLTGGENIVLKDGGIGMYFNNSYNSGENLKFLNCNFNGLTVDGYQAFNAQRLAFDGCSFTYNTRMGYSSNQYTAFQGCYFETSSNLAAYPTGTSGPLIAVDGGSQVVFDGDTNIFLLPASNSDLIAVFPGSGGYATVYFDGTSMCNENAGAVNVQRQFLVNTPNLNVYGHFRGYNGQNFNPAVSPNQSLQPDYNLASGALTFYPSSTHASAIIPATGSIAFTVNPTNTQTISIASTTVTFVTSGATGNQVNLGASLGLTFANLLSFLNASTDTNLVKCIYNQSQDSWGEFNTNKLLIQAVTTGTGGNSYALASTVTGTTLSASTLTGGAGGAVAMIFGPGVNITSQYGITNAAQLASQNGTCTLQLSTWDVNPGELIFISFYDAINVGGFTSFAGSQVSYTTADGIAVGTAALTQAAGVPNFTPGGANLNPNWGSGGGRYWTYQNFVFRVPTGASKMTMNITATNTATGSTYNATNFCIYSNMR